MAFDLRPLPLKQRKARLAQIGKRAEGWIALTNGVVGEGRALYRAVVDADLEGIVAKHLADAYHPKLGRRHKVLPPASVFRIIWLQTPGLASVLAPEIA